MGGGETSVEDNKERRVRTLRNGRDSSKRDVKGKSVKGGIKRSRVGGGEFLIRICGEHDDSETLGGGVRECCIFWCGKKHFFPPSNQKKLLLLRGGIGTRESLTFLQGLTAAGAVNENAHGESPKGGGWG